MKACNSRLVLPMNESNFLHCLNALPRQSAGWGSHNWTKLPRALSWKRREIEIPRSVSGRDSIYGFWQNGEKNWRYLNTDLLDPLNMVHFGRQLVDFRDQKFDGHLNVCDSIGLCPDVARLATRKWPEMPLHQHSYAIWWNFIVYYLLFF